LTHEGLGKMNEVQQVRRTAASEGLDKTMQQCRCTIQHDNHPGKSCDKPATTDDAYCQECHDKAVKEHADTQPDMLSY
jgi:hypothetical protein